MKGALLMVIKTKVRQSTDRSDICHSISPLKPVYHRAMTQMHGCRVL